MVNMKTDTSQKISLYGKFDLKNGKKSKDIMIKNKSICNIIEDFYDTLEKRNIEIEEIENVKK